MGVIMRNGVNYTRGDGSKTILIDKTITENGTYSASDDNADGYSEVTVDVASDVSGSLVMSQSGKDVITTKISIKVPSGIQFLQSTAFYGMDTLISVSLPDTLVSIGSSCFKSCRNLQEINLPNSITAIASEAFYSCSKIVSINLPNLLTSLPSEVFRYCTSLTSIDIPSGITSIGSSAFDSCISLMSITCRATIPPTLSNNNVFYNVPSACLIYVPSESVETYKSAQYWSARADYIQAISE